MRVPENFQYYLALHKDCKRWQIEAAKGLTALELEISTDAKEIHLRKMVNSVLSEVHRMMAFVRLKSEGNMILWGHLKPRHEIEEHISRYYAKRNQGMIVLLGNGSESWASLCLDGEIYQAKGRGLVKDLERLKSLFHCSGHCQDMDGLWQIYYDSQFCAEKKNLITFRRHMPKRDQDAAGLRLVQNKKGITLDDFMGGD